MAVETTPSTEAATEMMRTLPGPAYLGPDHFAREAEAIFHREWFQVGREESIPAPGDYLHVEVAGESVIGSARARASFSGTTTCAAIVDRDRSWRIRCAAATCRRRPGHFKGSIRCPYHAWTYGLDGDLRNAAFLSESEGLRREQLSLYPVWPSARGAGSCSRT